MSILTQHSLYVQANILAYMHVFIFPYLNMTHQHQHKLSPLIFITPLYGLKKVVFKLPIYLVFT
jgi:hypothetical protein